MHSSILHSMCMNNITCRWMGSLIISLWRIYVYISAVKWQSWTRRPRYDNEHYKFIHRIYTLGRKEWAFQHLLDCLDFLCLLVNIWAFPCVPYMCACENWHGGIKCIKEKVIKREISWYHTANLVQPHDNVPLEKQEKTAHSQFCHTYFKKFCTPNVQHSTLTLVSRSKCNQEGHDKIPICRYKKKTTKKKIEFNAGDKLYPT